MECFFWTDKKVDANTIICVLPSEYRPNITAYPNRIAAQNTFSSNGVFVIKNDGEITNQVTFENGTWNGFHAVWITE